MVKLDSKQASKQPYDEKERLQLIISALNTGLVLIDPDMTVVWANDIIKKWFPDANLVGKKCFAVAEKRTTPCEDCQAVAAFKDGEIHEREFQNQQPKRWFKVIAMPVKDQEGRVIYVLEATSDIDDRKRAEIARSRSEEESQRLRSELAHVSGVLSMGEIATSLAHEINQPLSAIQSYAQAAQRFLCGDPPDYDEVSKSLHGVVAANRRAKEVIQRIRMTLKKKPLERLPLQVRDLIYDVIMLVQRNADEKKILLKIDLAAELPQIFGDRIQLQQVLLNLIINGFEAISDAGEGFRELVVRGSKKEPDSVMISIQDSGIGIDEENRDLLFNAFFTTKTEGLGMGLSISRSIIEGHGGQLWATQNPYKGTTFSFTVPIYKESQR